MKVQPLPFVIERHFFTSVSVAVNPSFKPPAQSEIDADIDSTIDLLPHPDSPRRFQGHLRVQVNNSRAENVPYSADVICVCDVRIEDFVPESDCHIMAAHATNLIGFPAVRELVLDLTARQPWGAFSIGLAMLQPRAAAQSTGAGPAPEKRRRIRTTKVAKKAAAPE